MVKRYFEIWRGGDFEDFLYNIRLNPNHYEKEGLKFSGEGDGLWSVNYSYLGSNVVFSDNPGIRDWMRIPIEAKDDESLETSRQGLSKIIKTELTEKLPERVSNE